MGALLRWFPHATGRAPPNHRRECRSAALRHGCDMRVQVSPDGTVTAQARPQRSARRALKHPRLMPYHRLIAGVLLLNVALLADHLGDWRIDDGSALSGMAPLMLSNLAAAVLVRQQNVLNLLFGLAGRGSRTWPL